MAREVVVVWEEEVEGLAVAVAEEVEGLVAVVAEEVEAAAAVEEEEEEEANKLQQHQLPILQEMTLKECCLPFSEGTPKCSTYSSKNGICTTPPMLTTTT
jgi:hypothetical protein